MPKGKSAIALRLQTYAKEFGNVFAVDGSVLLCTVCSKTVGTDRKSQLHQHVKSAKHIANFERKSKKQQLLAGSLSTLSGSDVGASSSTSPLPDKFSVDLCKALVSANIPFHTLHTYILVFVVVFSAYFAVF